MSECGERRAGVIQFKLSKIHIMTAEQIKNIVAAAKAYMLAKQLSASKMADYAEINAGYLSRMLAGETTVISNEKEVPIADKWWIKLGNAAGLEMNDDEITRQITAQYTRIIAELTFAKTESANRTIIGVSGCGKTMAVKRFQFNNPLHTYVVTIHNEMTMLDIINEMCDQLGVPDSGAKAKKITAIINKLRDIKRSGGSPLLIIDEGENMNNRAIQLMKGLYDGINEYCGIAVMGTPKLLEKMQIGATRNRDGAPQYYRRFKAGIRELPGVMEFDLFFKSCRIADNKGLCSLLKELCNNYGELRDYLEPVMKVARKNRQEVSEELFRLYHNLPSYTR